MAPVGATLARTLPRSTAGRILLATLVTMALALAATPRRAVAGTAWDPLPPEAMTLAKSRLDPDADAEILLWKIRVEDEVNGPSFHTIIEQHIRTKVFTAKGAQDVAQVEIPHKRDIHIEGVAGRTVRPDGSVAELKKDQVFERISKKASDVNERVVAFALPAVTPGCVVEYRWTEIRYEGDAGYVSIDFTQNYPTNETQLSLKPLPLEGTDYNFKMRCFNMPIPGFENVDDYKRAVLPPMPARRVEPFMPPRRHVDPWAILYYTYGDDQKPEALWREFAAGRLKPNESKMAADASVREAAQSAIGSAATAAEKADRLAEWCRTTIDDISDDRLAMSETERAKFPKNKSAADTLKRKRGTLLDIACLFIAMCRSVGLDAKLAALADRSEVFFDPRLGIPNLLDNYCAAVATGSGWRFYDPGIRWLAPGSLWWTNEGEQALLLDSKNPEFTKTPLAPPESTWCRRSATLRLDAEGNALGWIRAEYAGHMGARAHEDYDVLSPQAAFEHFKAAPPVHASEILFDSLQVDGALEPHANVVERAQVKVSGYAQPVGDRLLVPLSFFEWKREPRFTDAKRRYPIYFSYPWAMSDTVTIELPEGYEVEAVPGTEPLVAKGVGGYQSAAMVSTDGRSVRFFRDFSFGVSESIYFPADQYAGIKKLFDGFAERDEVTLALRKKP